ncbi:MAG TPA: TonB-dependent receptor [Bacteroidales bacterium]|nr:TonB-dependent receptor [Bacteroidales bacterium]HRX97636.1 TonB-dependent receptor [Bacteroidales bacterium]
MQLKGLFLIISLFVMTMINAQNGFIRGTIFDAATGEYLPGVTVLIEGTTTGTITDLDGKFNISIEPGIYNLQFSFISYETLKVTNIEVKAGEAHLLDDVGLSEASINLEEVTVTAKAVRNTENALMTIKQKSANVVDGISASNFRKIGDSDAAASMGRVTGVSVEGGKYVYVRGLGDRYTKTILNGVDIPGLDPDRNTLQMDLFPTNVIDNILVHKSFSAELPADFTGGVIDIETKDFPEDKIGNFSVSAGYNPDMHFNSEYLTYEGGSLDWLGFDDGTRDIPATSNIPFFSDVVGNPNGADGQRYQEILGNFNPTLSAKPKTSFMDFSLGASFGNQIPKEKMTLGYYFSISYKNETQFYKDAEFNRYGLSSDPDNYEMQVREYQVGDYGVNNVLLSALAGFAIKKQNSKYRFNLMHLQNGESKAGIFDYRGSDQGSIFDALQHNLEYGQRSLTNLLIGGEHVLGDNDWHLSWKVSPTRASMKDPDVRFTRYEKRDNGWAIGTEVGFPERIWRDLDETDFAAHVDFEKGFEFNDRKARLKFGGAGTYKERDFVIQSFALNIRNVPLTGDPDELFYPENLWPIDGNVSSGTTYEARFVPYNPNKFNANTMNGAGYASVDLPLMARFKAVVGVRMENFTQRYTGTNQNRTKVLDNDKVLDELGFFPSVNLIFNLTENQNLRLSYAKTIARPSFKELSFAEIYDPISGRTFIGGLFRDADDVAGVEYWDGNLVSTDIQNFDLRWETFGKMGQMFSISGFYKTFKNPIEIVQYATQTGTFQPRNVGDGEVFGAETEFRLNLGTLTNSLSHLNFNANLTITESRIELSATEYSSRVENARTGQTIDKYRDMAGQAPYLVNVGFAYDGGQKGFVQGLEAGIYYNVQGETLHYVGIVDRPDIYSKPFNSLNLNANKRFGNDNRMQLGLKIENLLNSSKESIFKSYEAADQYFERLNPGIKFSLRFAYSLY